MEDSKFISQKISDIEFNIQLLKNEIDVLKKVFQEYREKNEDIENLKKDLNNLTLTSIFGF